ncbi:MAG: DUF58 domain-containing protein [Planctomycetes bacterium]|nr:DUF58 domain-containing protein [Planctomycetota bacterium]
MTNFIDPAALMRIKSLEMRAKVVVEGFFNGLHRSPFHGFSVEFSEYRQYTAGDDPRYLDWKLYARSDRCYIKQFEDETNLRCYLVADRSRSMAYGSQGFTKSDYAATLAATLGYFLTRQRDSVGLLTFDEDVVELIGARYRPGHLHRLMLALERETAGTATDLAAPLERIAQRVQKRGVIVLISDLLAPIDALERNLGYLRTRGHEVIVYRVLDPAEIDFRFDAPAMFRDLESGREVYIDPEATRQDYLRRFGEHSAAIEKTCANLGIDLHQFAIDRPLELSLFDYLHSRQRRGRQVMRSGRMKVGHSRSG